MNNTYNKEENIVIGVDAGGTKTRAAAFDKDGRVIAEAFAGCGNVVLDYDGAKSAIASAIRGVWSDSCVYIAAGAAGASSGELSERLAAELSAEFGVKTSVIPVTFQLLCKCLSSASSNSANFLVSPTRFLP